jgi:hypothetical protein
MKSLVKAVKAFAESLNDSSKQYFAGYLVTDNYGTNILCWTMKGAQSWLPYCSDRAIIRETYDYAPLVKRNQEC